MHRILKSRLSPPAFNLIELVIVIVIIGLITAIAVPRLSRSGAGSRRIRAGHDSSSSDQLVLAVTTGVYADAPAELKALTR